MGLPKEWRIGIKVWQYRSSRSRVSPLFFFRMADVFVQWRRNIFRLKRIVCEVGTAEIRNLKKSPPEARDRTPEISRESGVHSGTGCCQRSFVGAFLFLSWSNYAHVTDIKISPLATWTRVYRGQLRQTDRWHCRQLPFLPVRLRVRACVRISDMHIKTNEIPIGKAAWW